jgi:hypothetical protein
VPENVKTEATWLQKIPSDALSRARIGSDAFSYNAIGSDAIAELLIPTTLVDVGFQMWGQTDITFGDADMNIPYGQLN